MSAQRLAAPGPRNDGQMHWDHVDLSDPAARDWLARATDVDDRARRLLLEPGRAQHRLKVDGGFVASLPCVATVDADEDAPGRISLLLGQRRVISAHAGPSDAIDRLRGRMAHPDAPSTPLRVLAELVIDDAARAEELICNVVEEADAIEDLVLAEDDDPALSDVARLRHKVFRVRRPLMSQRNLLAVLTADRSLAVDADDRAALRSALDHVASHLETLENARESLHLLHDRIERQLSAHMNRVSYSLTVVAVVSQFARPPGPGPHLDVLRRAEPSANNCSQLNSKGIVTPDAVVDVNMDT